MRISAGVNGTRPVGTVGWCIALELVDDKTYLNEGWSGLIGIPLANWLMTPPLVLFGGVERSPPERFVFVLLTNADGVDELFDIDGIGLSIRDEWVSDEPLLIKPDGIEL